MELFDASLQRGIPAAEGWPMPALSVVMALPPEIPVSRLKTGGMTHVQDPMASDEISTFLTSLKARISR